MDNALFFASYNTFTLNLLAEAARAVWSRLAYGTIFSMTPCSAKNGRRQEEATGTKLSPASCHATHTDPT